MLEIELKVRVDRLDPVRNRLIRLCASPGTHTTEKDTYFNAPNRDFRHTDEALRVRYSSGISTLTYKGTKQKDFTFKAREELNTRVESGPVLELILDRLGFIRTAEVRKTREYFSYRGASIALDQVEGLGSFVEIEVIAEEGQSSPSDLIGQIAEELGISGEPILLSYLELLQSKQSAV